MEYKKTDDHNDDRIGPPESWRVPSIKSPGVIIIMILNILFHFTLFSFISKIDNIFYIIICSIFILFFNLFLYSIYGVLSSFNSRYISFYKNLMREYEFIYGIHNDYYNNIFDDPHAVLKNVEKIEYIEAAHRIIKHNSFIRRQEINDVVRSLSNDLGRMSEWDTILKTVIEEDENDDKNGE